ncbi:MAG: chromate efflux transporter, partial [Anaerolineae bacterium]|nr:chromate efflux transporter [Anaerolineae bacterium]
MTAVTLPPTADAAIPQQSYTRLFLRFLRFGALAWGGPVAQIGMIRQELVDEEHWVSSERFNRVLAVYQVLPGPEAHELCVYFGMQARGRIGGLLAGLGFMLPGFLLMLLLSWFYITYGINTPLFAGVFYGMQAVVGALIVRAVHRIGGHALHNRWLSGIAGLAFIAQLLGIPFLVTLLTAGLIYMLVTRKYTRSAAASLLVAAALCIALGITTLNAGSAGLTDTSDLMRSSPSALTLFGSGLRGGLLTFGGAYTV